MDRVSIDSLENHGLAADVQKSLSDPLSLSDAAMNYFEVDPGNSISGGMHTHTNQEEIFYVVEGTATFETPEETVEVGANEAIRFAPGEYQEGRNEGDERVRVLAIGAPAEPGETRVRLPCRECGADYHVSERREGGFTLSCPDCGNEFEV